jgi:hypothetical protein
MTLRSCYGCANLELCTECWEMPHIQWYECARHPKYSNLRNFPFHNTKCPDRVEVKRPPDDLRSMLEEAL